MSCSSEASSASSSSSGPSSQPPKELKFFTRGPNVFTAVQGYFDVEGLEPPIYAPTLLKMKERQSVDNYLEIWSDSIYWFQRGKEVFRKGNTGDLTFDNKEVEKLTKKLFFENWEYYHKVVLAQTTVSMLDMPWKKNVIMPESTPDGRESIKTLDKEQFVEISPKVLFWIISVLTLMGSMKDDVSPLVIPSQKSEYNASFDLYKHFDLRNRDGTPAKNESGQVSYYQMMLLVIGALFRTVHPAQEMSNILFVSAHWEPLTVLDAPLRANYEIDNHLHVLMSYEDFRDCFLAIFSREITSARLTSDEFM